MSAQLVIPKVRVGQLFITKNALKALIINDVRDALLRHAAADWGDVDEQDWKSNDEALALGERLLSQYRDSRGTKFWIITESDRSLTTVLLPKDY
jgi:hypothetical protein